MRIAYFSPLNPIQSGISDYSEELLPALAATGLQIELFVDEYKPTNREVATSFPVHSGKQFARLHQRQPFNAALYHMGNSPAHAYIYKAIFDNRGRLPGIVVMHEYVLHHLVMWMALNGGKKRDYQREMGDRYGAAGAEAVRRVLQGQTPESLFSFPLSERVIAAADKLIVHSQYMAAKVAEVAPHTPITVAPMGMPLPPAVDRAAARARLGIAPETFVVASLGHINPYKRLSTSLRAYKAFAMQQPASHYYLVGSVSPNYNLPRQVAALGLSERVTVTGHADTATYNDYMAATDVCINLRYPSAGETSAALLRIMGAGKAVIVSNTAAFAELPPAAAVRVDVDESEESLLLDYLLVLAADPLLRQTLARNARKLIASQHRPAQAAAAYYHALTGGYPVNYEPHTTYDEIAEAAQAQAEQQRTAAEQATASTINAAYNPPAPQDERLAEGALSFARVLAAAAAEVGVQESDEAILRGLACTAAEMDRG